jgi:LPXTG-site transpeptidase (sortase) family protein
LIGRIAIPRLHLTTTVREGTGEDTLVLAAGHIRGTAFPGQKGNIAVAAHRDTLFSNLAGIRQKDLILFETLNARYAYEVASLEIVKPENVAVLKPGREQELTLVTCYPFDYLGSAPDRFIVKARLVSQARVRNLIEASNDEPRRVGSAKVSAAASGDAPAGTSWRGRRDNGRVPFTIVKKRSQQLAPGVSVGLDETDPTGHIDGWIWVMPDRQTVWLRDQAPRKPVVFYQDGKRRELLITRVTEDAASGYLVVGAE